MFDTNNKFFKIIDFGESDWQSQINQDTKSLFIRKSKYFPPEKFMKKRFSFASQQ